MTKQEFNDAVANAKYVDSDGIFMEAKSKDHATALVMYVVGMGLVREGLNDEAVEDGLRKIAEEYAPGVSLGFASTHGRVVVSHKP